MYSDRKRKYAGKTEKAIFVFQFVLDTTESTFTAKLPPSGVPVMVRHCFPRGPGNSPAAQFSAVPDLALETAASQIQHAESREKKKEKKRKKKHKRRLQSSLK